MKYISLPKPERWIIKGIPFLILIGSLLHSLYDLCGKCIILAFFAPVNESVWEHTKMVFFPVIFWWLFYYITKGKEYKIDKNRWFTASLVALITAILIIPLGYYFYTGAFGVHLLWVDISLLFWAIILGQLLGLHFYRYSNGINYIIVIILFILLFAMYIWFTFAPPKLPLFKDSITGQYGIG